jgi:hypothetical protein
MILGRLRVGQIHRLSSRSVRLADWLSQLRARKVPLLRARLWICVNRFQDIELGAKLGEGAFATTYLATLLKGERVRKSVRDPVVVYMFTRASSE